MKKFLFCLAAIAAGLASVALSEVIMMSWISATPMEVTGNFFFLGVLPVELVVVSVASLVLWFVHKQNPVLYMGLYWATFAAAHAAELVNFGNPTMDILKYLFSITLGCVIWFFIISSRNKL